MSYSDLLQYTRDVAKSLSTEVTFVHGRKEVLTEGYELPLNNTGLVCWSLPFISTGTFTPIGQQFNENVTVNIIIYKKDDQGSEIDQNNVEETSPEMQVLSETRDLANEFVRKFNFNQGAMTSELSELLEITNVTFDNVIKDNVFYLTGTLITLGVTLPDQFDYCSFINP